MKKTILLIALCALGCYPLKAEKNESTDGIKGKTLITRAAGDSKEITDGGFFVNMSLILPSNNYGFPKGSTNTGDKFGLGGSMELGNMFKIVGSDKMGIGIRATWFTAFGTRYDFETTAYQASILKPGPYFTLGLTDNMAFDFHYQIAPTYVIVIVDGEGESYLGATHSAGFGFRFSVLNVGMDYNFGYVKWLDAIGENDPFYDNDFFKSSTSHLRVFLGVKF